MLKVKVPKGRFKKVWDFISRAEPDDSDAITVPTPSLMRSQCMEIHLQPTRDILLTGSFKIGLEVAINGCVSLIRCAFLQWVEQRGGLLFLGSYRYQPSKFIFYCTWLALKSHFLCSF